MANVTENSVGSREATPHNSTMTSVASALPDPYASTPFPNLSYVASPTIVKELRMDTLFLNGGIEALKQIPRSDLTEVLASTSTIETARRMFAALGHAENELEIQAGLRFVEVDRSPSALTVLGRIGNGLIGRGSLDPKEIFGDRVGPVIWTDYRHVSKGHLVFLNQTKGYWTNGEYQGPSYPQELHDQHARLVLGEASDFLAGIKDAQVPLARLAVNLWSEPNGLTADSNLIARIIVNAFPGQVEIVRSRSKSGPYSMLSSTDQPLPVAPAELDMRERRHFKEMMFKLGTGLRVGSPHLF